MLVEVLPPRPVALRSMCSNRPRWHSTTPTDLSGERPAPSSCCPDVLSTACCTQKCIKTNLSLCCARPSATPRLFPHAHKSRGFRREGGSVVRRARTAGAPQWRSLCGSTPSASNRKAACPSPVCCFPAGLPWLEGADSAVTVTLCPTCDITSERARARVARTRVVAARSHWEHLNTTTVRFERSRGSGHLLAPI